MADPPPAPAAPTDEDQTDLPLLPTWRAVYGFVLASFVLWVVLLTWLTRAFP